MKSGASSGWTESILLALLAGTALLRGSPATAQQPADADRKLARVWLLSDCGLGDYEKLEAQVQARAAALEPLFVEAAEKGPDADLLAQTERAAVSRYEARQKLLADQSDPIGLSGEDLASLRRMTRDESVAMEKKNLTVRYKSQGVAGLALIATPTARAALEKIAADSTSPVQSNAGEALKRLSPRS